MNPESRQSTRRALYLLIAIVVLSGAAGRVAQVASKRGGTPFLSANDRSRWSTIRSLVEQGTYALDKVIFRADGRREPEWYSIDLVRHRGPDGREHYYSSKPPLLSTLIAGEYWIVQRLTGVTLSGKPFYVGRLLLVLTNLLPFALYLGILTRLAERYLQTDWARVFVVTAGAAGTLLTTFLVTLNNHLIAAIATLVALDAVLRIVRQEDTRGRWWMLAGASAAFAAANELPALSFWACVTAALAWQRPRDGLLYYCPATLLIAAAFFGTNYAAHGAWRPAYGQRSDGPLVAELAEPLALKEGAIPPEWLARLRAAGLPLGPSTLVEATHRPDRWSLFDPATHQRYAALQKASTWEIRTWENWYDFPNSYWVGDRPQGVDRGEPSRARYAFHVLVGHHGIFSLTPIWGLSLIGLGLGIAREPRWRPVFAVIALISVVCIAFYLARPLQDRNYGGVTTGFRWALWLTPLWLLGMFPILDRFAASRRLRWLAYGLLAVSIFSASYGGMNPWTHPWLYDYWSHLGWLQP